MAKMRRVLKRLVRPPVVMHDVGERCSREGEPFFVLRERVKVDLAAKAVALVETSDTFRLLASVFPRDALRLYFQKKIHEEIHAPITQLCLLQVGAGNAAAREVVWKHHAGLGDLLAAVWTAAAVPLRLARGRSLPQRLRQTVRSLETRRNTMVRVNSVFSSAVPLLGISYRIGLDLSTRNDVYGLLDGDRHGYRCAVIFDGRYPKTVTPEDVRTLRDHDLDWICMETGVVPGQEGKSWTVRRDTMPLRAAIDALAERLANGPRRDGAWIVASARSFLQQVRWWLDFYHACNIKAHLEQREGNLADIVRKMALSLLGGIFIGLQRSQFFNPDGIGVGFYPRDVFFCWGKGSLPHLQASRSLVQYAIVSGYAQDSLFATNRATAETHVRRLRANAARFVIALFDNVYTPEFFVTRERLLSFYRYFLEWVIEDPDLGLVVKSKKPRIIADLAELEETIARAQATGRCVFVQDVLQAMPTAVSMAADMSVGIWYSTAVLESVIAGGRGMIWDPAGVANNIADLCTAHPIFFRDLDRLGAVLRAYMRDPSAHPTVGDCSIITSLLDPFRDGHAATRIGWYVRLLMEAVVRGDDREQAMRYANAQYAKRYGWEYVIDLHDAASTALPQRRAAL
ncbi:MAG: hypothetical protein HY543_02195 [Deltaproteobacteria bacterium]|nr:hypothetical protein [Deltaproteobacteria bacterium]